MYLLWHDCFEHFHLGVWVLLFHEEEKEEVVVGVVVRMEYLVSLANVGMQVILFFQVLTQNVHPAPNTQQAEQSWLHKRKE
jgi:hypothetical protein